MIDAIRLSFQLFSRNIRAKFRKTFLGYFWLVIPAVLITAGVWVATRAGVIDPGVTTLPYFLYAFIGTTMWQIFAEGLELPFKAIEGARSYLTRVMFPREAVIFVQLYEALINTLVRMVAALLLMAITGHLTLPASISVLAVFLLTLLLATGIGCLLAPFMILFGDMHNGFRLFVTYGLFLTPALYRPQRAGFLADLVAWNPVTPLMRLARDAIAGGGFLDGVTGAWVAGVSAAMLIVGMWFVRKSIPIVAERMLLGGR